MISLAHELFMSEHYPVTLMKKKKINLNFRIALLQQIVVVLSQTKTTLCKTQSSMACTSICSCQGSEGFNVHTKQVEIELDDDDD